VRENKGKGSRAYSEPVVELSGLGDGSVAPESSPELVGTAEEDDGAGGDVVVLDSVQWHGKERRSAT
jgi:hypothetical protein